MMVFQYDSERFHYFGHNKPCLKGVFWGEREVHNGKVMRFALRTDSQKRHVTHGKGLILCD